MDNKRKKVLDEDGRNLIENGIFTEDEVVEVDEMIFEMIAASEGREATEEELAAFERCTEEEHFKKIDNIMIKE